MPNWRKILDLYSNIKKDIIFWNFIFHPWLIFSRNIPTRFCSTAVKGTWELPPCPGFESHLFSKCFSCPAVDKRTVRWNPYDGSKPSRECVYHMFGDFDTGFPCVFHVSKSCGKRSNNHLFNTSQNDVFYIYVTCVRHVMFAGS